MIHTSSISFGNIEHRISTRCQSFNKINFIKIVVVTFMFFVRRCWLLCNIIIVFNGILGIADRRTHPPSPFLSRRRPFFWNGSRTSRLMLLLLRLKDIRDEDGGVLDCSGFDCGAVPIVQNRSLCVVSAMLTLLALLLFMEAYDVSTSILVENGGSDTLNCIPPAWQFDFEGLPRS